MKTKAINKVLPLLKLYPWAIPAIICLGSLSSLLEGIGISLFIPLLQTLEPQQAERENLLIAFFNQVFNNVASQQRTLIIGACILASILVKNCFVYANSILFAWLNSRINARLRSRIFNQLLNVSYSFLEASEPGKLLNTLATETWRTSQALAVLVGMIINVCTISVFVILLLLISWQLTLLVAVLMLLISISIQLVTREVKNLGQKAVEVNSALTMRMWEGLGAMKIIRAFNREPYEQKRFDQASEEVRTNFLKLDMLSAIVHPLSEVLSAFLLLGILALALTQTQNSLPTLLTFIFILYRLQPQVKQLDGARVTLSGLISAVDDVMYLLNTSDKAYIRSGQIPFQGLQQAISLSAVSFYYHHPENPAIEDISICIPKGTTTALVGPSGAGKSTLINLICRLYEANEGEIYVDGRPLRSLNLTDWRERIAIVSQDIYIFNATVQENIAYGRLDATKDEIVAAAKLANADEFITQLPQEYNTKVGDRGLRLSGGQRQRIALARAIIRNPEILILDEATNALDSISEHLIQEALNTLSQNRTVIVIAHRLSTIEQADQIIVLQQGRVIEQGTLEHLLKLEGLFAQMYQLQYSHSQTTK